jgi:hypothetical protein
VVKPRSRIVRGFRKLAEYHRCAAIGDSCVRRAPVKPIRKNEDSAVLPLSASSVPRWAGKRSNPILQNRGVSNYYAGILSRDRRRPRDGMSCIFSTLACIDSIKIPLICRSRLPHPRVWISISIEPILRERG